MNLKINYCFKGKVRKTFKINIFMRIRISNRFLNFDFKKFDKTCELQNIKYFLSQL